MTGRTERMSRALQTVVNPFDWGYVGDGSAGDTAKLHDIIQTRVVNSLITRSVFFPAEVMPIVAPLTFDKPLHIRGEGFEAYKGMLNTGLDVHGKGSFLKPTHLGQAIQFTATVPMSGIQLEDFCIWRPQPLPAPGWAPTDYDYDIYIQSGEALLKNIGFLSSTRGFKTDFGNYGKITMEGCHGQFFKNAVYLDKQYDVPMINGFRAWSYAFDDANIIAFQRANLDTFTLLRCDNPQLLQVFSIAHRAGIRIGQSANDPIDPGQFPGGTTAKLKIVNADLDIGKYGLWIDSTVTTVPASVQATNLTVQGDAIAGSIGVLLEGANCKVDLVNPDLQLFDQNGIKNVDGSGNVLTISGKLLIKGYNAANGGYAAVACGGTNTVDIDHIPDISGDGGTAGRYSAGTILVPDWRAFTPTITPAAGAFTTLTLNGAVFRHTPVEMEVELDFTIVNAGTGSGAINVQLPAGAPLGPVILRGYVVGGAAVLAAAGPGATSVALTMADGTTTAIAAGATIRLAGSYRS